MGAATNPSIPCVSYDVTGGVSNRMRGTRETTHKFRADIVICQVTKNETDKRFGGRSLCWQWETGKFEIEAVERSEFAGGTVRTCSAPSV